jgi:hypothetical protein
LLPYRPTHLDRDDLPERARRGRRDAVREDRQDGAAETGKLLTWNNQTPEGQVNGNTLHHGMKVRAGTKYVVTKWFRERPWTWA